MIHHPYKHYLYQSTQVQSGVDAKGTNIGGLECDTVDEIEALVDRFKKCLFNIINMNHFCDSLLGVVSNDIRFNNKTPNEKPAFHIIAC